MFSARYQILRVFYALCDKINQRRDQKNAEKQAEQEHLNAYLERQKTEKLLFLALLKTMVEVCEELKPLPWVHEFGGWDPGLTVRALYNPATPTEPIYSIHHESPCQNNGSSNYYSIGIFKQAPEFDQIYYGSHLFVPNGFIPYINAVFDLTARRNMSSPERARKLKQLKNLKIKKTEHWNEYPMAHAIQYLESLLTKNSK